MFIQECIFSLLHLDDPMGKLKGSFDLTRLTLFTTEDVQRI